MEKWKQIPGYEGIYDASDMGRIRSTPGKTTRSALYNNRTWKTRVMKVKWEKRPCGKMDARVCLWKDGKEHTHLVARLVALAWCDGYSDGMTVNHIDGNPENNRADNLEWVKLSDNIRHAFDTGLCSSFQTPVCLVDTDGVTHKFRSLADASRFLGRSTGYVSNVIHDYRDTVYSITRKPYLVVRTGGGE